MIAESTAGRGSPTRHPALLVLTIALIVAACGSGAGATATPRPAATSARPSAGVSTPAANTPAYRSGAATARVTMEGKTYEFANGTCAQPPVFGYQFQLIAGKPLTSPSFEISVVDLQSPLHDGEYATGLDVVSFSVEGRNYVVAELRTTFRDGVTAGEFRGVNANPAVPVSGTFDCG